MEDTTNIEQLQRENESLRQENARLQTTLDEILDSWKEPEEVLRAIRQGEVDALVVENNGQQEIYSLQRFDSVYRSMVEETLPYGVWLAEMDGSLLYVSRSFQKLLNTDLQQLRTNGQFHTLPAADRQRVERLWQRCRQTGDVLSVEYTVPHDDGTERVIWTHGILARPRDGRAFWVGINLDVTERHQIKDELLQQTESLRLSEQRFRLIADTMPQMVWVTRADGRHEYYNRKWYDYIGGTPHQFSGNGLNLPLHPADLPRAIDRWNRALRSGEPYETEYRIRGRDGHFRWFLGRALPVRDESGQIVRWFGTCTDIEQMKRAEEALRESEARYRAAEERLMAALAASDTGTFRWNPLTGTFLDFDDSLKALFGLPPEIAVQTAEDFIHRVHPEDRAKLVAAVEHCRRGADLEMEYRVLLSDGSVRWLYERAKMMRDAAGQPTYLVGACIDVTSRKQTEEALQDADRRKDEFLATLAHELRNPLAPIRTGLELLKLAGDDRNLADETHHMMEEQVEQMVHLIDDLFELSRITRGKLQLRKAITDLSATIRSALDATRPLIEQSAHTLTVSLPAEPLYVDADPVRLAQIFSNLLNNAAKYTDRGGQITLTAERQGGDVVVSVRDTGIGIPAEHLPKLFEPFSQLDAALERSQGGLGIGLALVHGLVEMHGGTVEAHSDGSDQGSRFVVRLPALAAPAPPPPQRQPAGQAPALGSQCRVLVVDDNQDAAHTLATLLTLMGNEVCMTHDGREAVQMAASFRPRLILLDIGMPKMNGYEAARRIRDQPWGHDITLVALTGWGQEEDKRRSKEAGFDYHLVKPADPLELQRLLRTVEPTRPDPYRP